MNAEGMNGSSGLTGLGRIPDQSIFGSWRHLNEGVQLFRPRSNTLFLT